MKLKRSQLRKMILNEVRMANPAVSPMRSRAHPDFARALRGESLERPDPLSVREIVFGLDRALAEPPLSTSSSLTQLYPNLAQHMRLVKNYLNGRGRDPGDINVTVTSNMSKMAPGLGSDWKDPYDPEF
jgi:hypothetical protein|tara:strand:+ start:1993 stop:2379 length:387 start_codon:yes stop_codon:yes gene_type:complete